MIRTFLALEAPERLASTLKEILKRYSLATPPGINWVKPENLHLTLLFIGDVPEHLLGELEPRIQQILEGMPAFEFAAQGLELFPAREPRLLWLKLATREQRIFQLNRSLLRALEDLGIKPDPKTLKLHITLARLKTGMPETLARELLQYPFEHEYEIYDTLCLFRSVLSPSGPRYSVINSYKMN